MMWLMGIAGFACARPEPESETVFGLPLPLYAIVNVPLSAPLILGSKRTLISHARPIDSWTPQFCSCVKSAPEIWIELMETVEADVFVTTTFCETEVVPTIWPGNVSDELKNVSGEAPPPVLLDTVKLIVL